MPPYIGSFSPNFSLEADAWGSEEEDEIKTDKLFDMKELKKCFVNRYQNKNRKHDTFHLYNTVNFHLFIIFIAFQPTKFK